MRVITQTKPTNLDLAVPPLSQEGKSGVNLRQIMEGYSRYQSNWEFAGNVEYRHPDGRAIGVLAEKGTVHWKTQLNWPVFYVDDRGGARIALNGHLAPLQTAKLAFSGGPWLVRDGERTDVAAEIARTDGLDDSLRPTQLLPRRAIGIRPSDGMVVDIIDTGARLDDIGSDLRMLGCTHVIALDGGGSAGQINRKGEVAAGLAIRDVCSALVIRKIESRRIELNEEPSAPPLWRPVIPGLVAGEMYFAIIHPEGKATTDMWWHEFACNGTRRLFIARYLVDMCQFIRDGLGGPLNVSSGHRAPSYNVRQPGADMDSFHTMGLAVDLAKGNWNEGKMISLAREFGWRGGLGIYRTFLHFDLGPIRAWRG